VGVSFSRSSEIKTTLGGAINPELLKSLNDGLNNLVGMQIWHDAGSVFQREVRQINFALAGMLPREGAYNLPPGWTRLKQELLTTAEQRNSKAWSTYTTGTVTVPVPFGRIGVSTQLVERMPIDFGPRIAQTYDQLRISDQRDR